MRIISGKLKGKSIQFIDSKITRPLKDSVKENIFNILSHSNKFETKIKKARVLDLYSGIGSFGLECLSREASSVTFFEQNLEVSNTLKENLLRLSIFRKAKIINNKIENYSDWNKKDKYDIFFLDPPFADNFFIHNLKIIKKNKIYKNKHIVIIHREKSSNDNFEDLFVPLIIKKYGRSKIIFGKFT